MTSAGWTCSCGNVNPRSDVATHENYCSSCATLTQDDAQTPEPASLPTSPPLDEDELVERVARWAYERWDDSHGQFGWESAGDATRSEWLDDARRVVRGS